MWVFVSTNRVINKEALKVKKCLKYMSGFWGPYKYILIFAFIMLAIFQKNAFMIVWITYAVNAMSLSIYGSDIGYIYKTGDHEKLTLSLPMSRKAIYDTRMYLTGALYLAGIVLAIIPFIPKGKLVGYFGTVSLLLFGHLMCALFIRFPILQGLSGLPAIIVLIMSIVFDWMDILDFVNERLESVKLVWVAMVILCTVLVAVDVFVWIRERRIFIEGSVKGNTIKKKDDKKDEDNKKKISKPIIVLIAVASLAVIIRVMIPILGIGLLIFDSFTSQVEVHTNVNDYLKYHSGPQAEDEYKSKWSMDETIWPEKITTDMTIEDYKMVYYNPWDKQFLGYLTVKYDEENYDKEVKRLKDYESTAYLGYYGVTGFEDYELLAMYADSDQGFVYALTDGKDKIIYVEIIFCNHFMDLKYEKYIPADYLPKGFDAKMDNPYQKKWEKENGLDDLQIF